MTILICQEMLANQKPTPPSGWKIRIDSMDINELTGSVIGAAIEVHKALGPGLLESVYEECLCRELNLRGIPYQRQKEIPIEYKGSKLDCGYRIDILVAEALILEIKACESLQRIHEAQLLTYLKLTGLKVGLVINFNVPVLKEGIKRISN
jgi:GxxExxY protein